MATFSFVLVEIGPPEVTLGFDFNLGFGFFFDLRLRVLLTAALGSVAPASVLVSLALVLAAGLCFSAFGCIFTSALVEGTVATTLTTVGSAPTSALARASALAPSAVLSFDGNSSGTRASNTGEASSLDLLRPLILRTWRQCCDTMVRLGVGDSSGVKN